MPSIRQRFHLSPCSDFRSHFWIRYGNLVSFIFVTSVIDLLGVLGPSAEPEAIKEYLSTHSGPFYTMEQFQALLEDASQNLREGASRSPVEKKEFIYTLSVSVSPPGAGSVSFNPPCGSYSSDTPVTLTATPAEGFAFSHWEGGDFGYRGGGPPVIYVGLDADQSITAYFVLIPTPTPTPTPTSTPTPTPTPTATPTPIPTSTPTATPEGENYVVTFPDANLEANIRIALDKGPEEGIWVADLATISELRVRSQGIVDLSGIEHLVNLTYLDLWNNEVTDLTPLSSLSKLTFLAPWGNRVTDLSPLANLTGLTSLFVSFNQIIGLGPLASLANLRTLQLNSTQITDLSPLANLTNLEQLGFEYNAVGSLSPLSALTKLISINASYTNISDLSDLATHSNLERLYLNGNGISDLSPLVSLSALTTLLITRNRIVDIAPLSPLTARTNLFLSNNLIIDVSPLQSLVNIARLTLTTNQISNISALLENEGLGPGDEVNLRGNLLDLTEGPEDLQQIAELQDRGVVVDYD